MAMFRICTRETFIQEQYDAIFCYGTAINYFEYLFINTTIQSRIFGFIDDNKCGKKIYAFNQNYNIYSSKILEGYEGKKIAIVVIDENYYEIIERLLKKKELNNADILAVQLFESADSEEEASRKKIPDNLQLFDKPIIPKVIHYCWFGKNEIPDKYKRWMESWKKFCPDYEIVEWNENNYDISKNMYMYQAYKNKKWGFVPDYARLDIIYNHGGIYLDTDVEIIKNFDDMLYQKGFVGFETNQYVNFGSGFGAVAGLPIIKEQLDYYENRQFIKEDGTMDLTASPRIQTDILVKNGMRQNGEYQIVNDIVVYPEKLLCPKSERLRKIRCTEYTHSIHHYDASWLNCEEKKTIIEKEKLVTEASKYTSPEIIINMSEKVSVVVIAYNVEQYIEECVKSIRNQSYSNLEIILVDDGSTDLTSKICDKEAEADERIKVIHKDNEGLVGARQAGAKIATGKYITFVDGDDWIEQDMYLKLISYAENYNVDIVASGIIRDFGDRKKYERNLVNQGYYSKKIMEKEIYPNMMFSLEKMNHYIDPSLCNKLFKRDLLLKSLKKVDKEIYYLGEDAATLYPLLLDANGLFVCDTAFYHHRIVTSDVGNATYKTEKSFERLIIWYKYLQGVFSNSIYSEVMLPQLEAYYMMKLNQMSIKNVDVDFIILLKRFYLSMGQGIASNISSVKYILPEENIKKESKIILYGAGMVGRDYQKQLSQKRYNVISWVDKEYEKYRDKGYQVNSISSIKKLDFDLIFVALKKEELFNEVREQLMQRGIEKDKIVWGRPSGVV